MQPPKDIKEIQTIVENMNGDAINNSVKESLKKSSNLLPTSRETTVCIFPSELVHYPMVTEGAGKIVVLYNKLYDEEFLKVGVAHEYQHSVWTEKYFSEPQSFTVLDNLVMEGKAVMFEKLAYPNYSLTKVNYRINKDYWEKIEPDLDKVDPNRASEILSGGGELPPSYGYSEGFKIVKSYIDLHPNVKPEEWSAMSAKELYVKGKYIDKFK